MTESLDRSVELLYRAVRELPALEQRRVLDGTCYDQPALREQVEQRLAKEAAVPIDHPTAEYWRKHVEPSSQVDFALAPGTIVGRYKLLEEIGEGGFGVVFVAQQREPVKRKVALKVIKLGMDTRQVIARFEAERQTLAMMDHPHIARVLDAGTTPRGRPYFVMEFVRGEPITVFCDKKRMPISPRLRLFQQVCRAVQHAHQKGVIHRDIKPTNVLVSTTDDEPHVKVIDFGIAKATNQEMTERTLVTEFQQLVGTPVYMSPEQIERTGVDIDTRADIYSLGILLYELLTGSTPFDMERLTAANWNELQQIICEEEPPSLAQRVDRLEWDRQRNRTADAPRLKSLLQGDLNWIVMKAIDKDRRRRYGTANELSEEIDRYLRDEPVRASPPTTWYRFQKFRRRNRLPLAVGSMVLGAVFMTLVVTTSFMIWAFRERNRAHQATARAEQEAIRAERFSSLAGTTFLTADDVIEANKRWGDEIRELHSTLDPTDPERIRREAQYVTWLLTQAVHMRDPELLSLSVVDIQELQERAKSILGLDNAHFLSLADAHVRAAILLEDPKPDEIVNLIDDVLASYGSLRGQDATYKRFLLERMLAASGSLTGRQSPATEALRVLAETSSNIGLSIDTEGLGSRRWFNALQQQVDQWQTKRPTWYHSLFEGKPSEKVPPSGGKDSKPKASDRDPSTS